jgi:hypothetical protein
VETNGKGDCGRSGSVRPPEPSLINRYANAQDGHICGGISDEGGAGAAFLRLAGARFAADFFEAVFFFAAVFLPTDFFAAPFFTAPLRTAFLATTLRALFFAATFFAGLFLAADFFAVFLVAAFAMCCVPLIRLPCARILRAMQERERRYIRFDSAQEFKVSETPAQQDDYRIIARMKPSLRGSTTK